MKVIKNIIYMLKYLWKIDKWYMPISFVSILFAIINPFIDIYLYKKLIDNITEKISFLSIFITLGLMFGLGIIASLLQKLFFDIIFLKRGTEITTKMQLIVAEKALSYDVECYESSEFYNMYVKAATEAEGRVIWVWNTCLSIVSYTVALATIFVIVVGIDIFVLIFSIASVILGFIFQFVTSKNSFKLENGKTEVQREQAYFSRNMYLPSFIYDIKMTKIKEIFFDKLINSKNKIITLIKTYGYKVIFFDMIKEILFSIIQFGTMIYLSVMIFLSHITIGAFTSMLNASGRFSDNLKLLINTIPDLYKHSLFIDNFKKFMEYKPKIDKEDGIILNNFNNSIIMNNVSFKYPNTDELVIKNICLEINKGEKIAIVGENGAGKTTLIKLILRFYDPTHGEVKIDNINYKNINVSSLRKKFSILFQDYSLYATSIAENVIMQKNTKSNNITIADALTKAGVIEKVNESKYGIDTIATKEFNDDGASFSGGERQKIALARIYYNEKEIVVLDEANASLDPISEYKMNQNILNLTENKTTIFISHRLTNVKRADKIFYMENGMIIEQGSHNELIKLNGKYAYMYNLQSSNFNEDKDVF